MQNKESLGGPLPPRPTFFKAKVLYTKETITGYIEREDQAYVFPQAITPVFFDTTPFNTFFGEGTGMLDTSMPPEIINYQLDINSDGSASLIIYDQDSNLVAEFRNGVSLIRGNNVRAVGVSDMFNRKDGIPLKPMIPLSEPKYGNKIASGGLIQVRDQRLMARFTGLASRYLPGVEITFATSTTFSELGKDIFWNINNGFMKDYSGAVQFTLATDEAHFDQKDGCNGLCLSFWDPKNDYLGSLFAYNPNGVYPRLNVRGKANISRRLNEFENMETEAPKVTKVAQVAKVTKPEIKIFSPLIGEFSFSYKVYDNDGNLIATTSGSAKREIKCSANSST